MVLVEEGGSGRSATMWEAASSSNDGQSNLQDSRPIQQHSSQVTSDRLATSSASVTAIRNVSTLHAFFIPRWNRKRRVIIEESSDDEEDDCPPYQVGTKEMPITLSDEAESSDNSDQSCASVTVVHSPRKRRRLAERSMNELNNEITTDVAIETPNAEEGTPPSSHGVPLDVVLPGSSRHLDHILPENQAGAGDSDSEPEVIFLNEVTASSWSSPDRNNSPRRRHRNVEGYFNGDPPPVHQFAPPRNPIDDGIIREVEEFEARTLKLAGPFSLAGFEEMWERVEENFGVSTLEIEDGKLIRGANNKVTLKEAGGIQSMAQYGRLLPSATNKLLTEILCLNESDVFVDFGHGIGNACLQAAYTVGCEARGIEVIHDRHLVAQQFCSDLHKLNEIRLKKDSIKHKVGKVILKQGSLEAKINRSFLTSGVTAALANNFNGVFRERSSDKNQLYFLDDYIVGLFAQMSPGARLITLQPLPLCGSRSEINQRRARHNLSESEDASFFEYEEIELDEARKSVSWSEGGGCTKIIKLFKYTRVKQSFGESVFLCCNSTCKNSSIPIVACIENSDGRLVLNRCDCGQSPCTLRPRKAKTRQ